MMHGKSRLGGRQAVPMPYYAPSRSSPRSSAAPPAAASVAAKPRPGRPWLKTVFYFFLFLVHTCLMILVGVTLGKGLSSGSTTNWSALSASQATLAAGAASTSTSAAVGGVAGPAAALPGLQDGSFKLPAAAADSTPSQPQQQQQRKVSLERPRKEGGSGGGRDRFWPRMDFPVPTDAELADTALVTMATGDESGRHAVALIQSLRDSGTRIPNILVMLFRGSPGSADCQDPVKRKKRQRDHISCEGPDTTAEEIVSQVRTPGWQMAILLFCRSNARVEHVPALGQLPFHVAFTHIHLPRHRAITPCHAVPL